MEQQPAHSGRWHRASALLALLCSCCLSRALVPAAAAQSAAELQAYRERLEQLFQRLDHNNDQRLERWEVEGVPYLERHFERLDQQLKGYLSLDDLRPNRWQLRRDRASRVFSRSDRNGDGQLDRREAESVPWLLKHFDAIDTNGDGVLSREELRQWRWHLTPR